MVQNSPPSGNPADRHNLRGVIRLVLNKFLQKVDDCLPAIVIAYNLDTNMAQVQPLVAAVTTDNQIVNKAQVASVPVYQISAGGFILRFPVKPGDIGWIKANDRDISLFMQTGKMSPPNTQRKHSFKDALFYPQTLWPNVTIAGGDAANCVLQNYAGTVKISLSETAIVINAPTAVTVNTETATINASSTVDINGSSTINMVAPNINISASTKLSLHSGANVSFDADGTGVVYTPSLITSYTNGVATASNAPNPPGPL